MTFDLFTAAPPSEISLTRSWSDILAMSALLERSPMAWPLSIFAAGPSPLPSAPWHLRQNFLKLASPPSARRKAAADERRRRARQHRATRFNFISFSSFL